MKRMFLMTMVVAMCLIPVFALSDEKETLQLELRALVAEYNLAFSKFQQASPEVKALNDFFQKVDAKGLQFVDGKIVEKPKAQAPAPPAVVPTPEAPKSKKK